MGVIQCGKAEGGTVSIKPGAWAVLALILASLLVWPAGAQGFDEEVDLDEEEALIDGEEDLDDADAATSDDAAESPAEEAEPEEGAQPEEEAEPEEEELIGEEEVFEEEWEEPVQIPEPRIPPPGKPRFMPRPPPLRPTVRSSPTELPPPPEVEPVLPSAPNNAYTKNGQTPANATMFDFTDTPLNTVIESIARMTGRNFDVDPNIGATRVTVITHDRIPPEMAYEVLESILNSRGFAMVETLDGHLVKIIPMGDFTEKLRLFKGAEGIPDTYDVFTTHIVTVKHADVGELATILKLLGSRACTVDAYARTNTLIITDTADGLRRVFSFLEEVDVPGYDTDMEIFTLEYTRAEVLAQQIEQVLLEQGATTTSTSRTTRRPVPTRPPVRPTVPGRSQPVIIGSSEEILRIVPDERLNAIIVIATENLMERVRDLVAKLDTPTPYEANNMHVYELLNADAEQVEGALNAIIGGAPPRQRGDAGSAQSGEVQPFEKKVLIARYEQTNALLILASPQDYKLIKEIIAQLDVPQRQVLVEAIIMDVSIQNRYGLTVDGASLTGNDAFVMGDTSNLAELVSAADLATSLADGTAPLTTAAALLNLGSSGGLTFGVYDEIETKINGQKIKIPFIPFLIRSLETLTDLDILSQPSLTTQDNETASIIIGQELPVPSARSGAYYYDPETQQRQSRGQYRGSTGRGISREDVGVKMEVTPHINEGDYVSIELTIEVSEAAVSDIGIDPNELGPTFNKTQVDNNVVVKDGMTGVIGGLLKETASHTKNQSPGLGDLPLLGWLFRSRSDERKKQNVVILITPYIIKDGSDLERVSRYKMDDFRTANVDVLFERGFIKKVKKRHQMRSKYRPSVQRAEDLLIEDRFGRGDIER